MNVEVGSFGRKESHWMRFTWIFDKVLNMRLLNKMRTHGITEKIRAWIEDWLTGRSDNSQIFQPDVLRNRRNSTTVMNRHSQIVPSSPVRIPSSRLHQIKQEEGMDLMNRETAHERGVQAAMQMSVSWEESLNLGLNNPIKRKRVLAYSKKMKIDIAFLKETHLNEKQCFSPSLQIFVSSNGLPPSPNPSPTRRFTTRRSQSPINCIRPSVLGPLKRKGEMEAESQPKRLFQGTASMLPSDPSHSPERGPCPVQSGDVFLSLSTDCLDGNISNGNSGQDSLAKCNAVRVSPVATSDPCLSFTTDPECPPK
ncbi:protein FAM122B isoform X5 [Narcine bancroftii]|uniref:protein FAM122B isoform X5 n=1 Tax=Narcine bancroftii TaxID=1343680 RepID=UPI00383124BB